MILTSPKRNEVHEKLLGTAPCVTQSSSAASVMLRWRAVASKARNAFSDGMTGSIVCHHRTGALEESDGIYEVNSRQPDDKIGSGQFGFLKYIPVYVDWRSSPRPYDTAELMN